MKPWFEARIEDLLIAVARADPHEASPERKAAWDEIKRRERSRIALAEAITAAEPFARLPFPVSADEREEWRENQQRLIYAIDAAAAISQEVGDDRAASRG